MWVKVPPLESLRNAEWLMVTESIECNSRDLINSNTQPSTRETRLDWYQSTWEWVLGLPCFMETSRWSDEQTLEVDGTLQRRERVFPKKYSRVNTPLNLQTSPGDDVELL